MASIKYNSAAGRETENMVAAYMSEQLGLEIERRRLKGAHDMGDLVGVPGWTVEVKKSLAKPAEACDQLEDEIVNAGTPYGLAVIRRKGNRDPASWYALQPLNRALDIVRLTLSKGTT